MSFAALSFIIALFGLYFAYRTYKVSTAGNQGQTPQATQGNTQLLAMWTSHPDPSTISLSDIQDYLINQGYSWEDATTAAATAQVLSNGDINTQLGIIKSGNIIQFKLNTTSLTGGPRTIGMNSSLEAFRNSIQTGATSGSNTIMNDRNPGGSQLVPPDMQPSYTGNQ